MKIIIEYKNEYQARDAHNTAFPFTSEWMNTTRKENVLIIKVEHIDHVRSILNTVADSMAYGAVESVTNKVTLEH